MAVGVDDREQFLHGNHPPKNKIPGSQLQPGTKFTDIIIHQQNVIINNDFLTIYNPES
jgi:hypothetical protein